MSPSSWIRHHFRDYCLQNSVRISQWSKVPLRFHPSSIFFFPGKLVEILSLPFNQIPEICNVVASQRLDSFRQILPTHVALVQSIVGIRRGNLAPTPCKTLQRLMEEVSVLGRPQLIATWADQGRNSERSSPDRTFLGFHFGSPIAFEVRILHTLRQVFLDTCFPTEMKILGL